MSEGHDGSTVIVIAPGEGAAIEGEAVGDVQAPLEVEAVEEVTVAAVEIARIEADRDVTLAVIAAETEEVRVEAFTEQEIEVWRTRAITAEELCTVQQRELERLTSPPSPPSPPNPSASIEPGTGEGSTSNEEPEPVAEAEVLAAEETPEPPKAKRHPHRWI